MRRQTAHGRMGPSCRCLARHRQRVRLNLSLRRSLRLPPPHIQHRAPTMSDERRPRSRFDSDEPDRAPRSRFDTDRRSRSPTRRESESHRERSPASREATDSPANAGVKNKAAAAAAAAARINAQIQAKKGIQHVDVPPIRSVRIHLRTPAQHNTTNNRPGAHSSRRPVADDQSRPGCCQRNVPAGRRLYQGH
jgi:hypothetical protein